MLKNRHLPPILITILFIVLLAAGPAVAVELENKDVPRITAEEVQQLQSKEAVTIIDTRKPDQWEQAADKIPGAIRVTTYEQLFALQQAVKADAAIVTYCT